MWLMNTINQNFQAFLYQILPKKFRSKLQRILIKDHFTLRIFQNKVILSYRKKCGHKIFCRNLMKKKRYRSRIDLPFLAWKVLVNS